MERFDPTKYQYEEVLSREGQLAKLEKTEGWARLTKKQQAMILASLSLQRRHDSGRRDSTIKKTRQVVRDFFVISLCDLWSWKEFPILGSIRD